MTATKKNWFPKFGNNPQSKENIPPKSWEKSNNFSLTNSLKQPFVEGSGTGGKKLYLPKRPKNRRPLFCRQMAIDSLVGESI